MLQIWVYREKLLRRSPKKKESSARFCWAMILVETVSVSMMECILNAVRERQRSVQFPRHSGVDRPNIKKLNGHDAYKERRTSPARFPSWAWRQVGGVTLTAVAVDSPRGFDSQSYRFIIFCCQENIETLYIVNCQ